MPQFESHFFSSLIFWEVVSFAILFFVLYKFAFPGILSMLEEREKKIKDSLDQAEHHRSEAERKFKEYEAKLNSAAKEAEGILAAAKERGVKLGGYRGEQAARAAAAAKAAQANAHAHRLKDTVAVIRAGGMASATGLAKELNRRGVTTPRGGSWQTVQAQRLLARLDG